MPGTGALISCRRHFKGGDFFAVSTCCQYCADQEYGVRYMLKKSVVLGEDSQVKNRRAFDLLFRANGQELS